MKKIGYSILFVIFFLPAYCAENEPLLNVIFIPDSLKKDAYAVVRERNIVFDYETLEKGTYTEKKTITILNEKGKEYADFEYPGDKYRVLSDFSGKIYDAAGNLVRKIKKSEVQSSEWSPYLSTGDVHYFFDCSPPSYPFTVEYEFSVNFKNGVFSFPSFMPQFSSVMSVQSANYKLNVPQNTKITQKELNISPGEKSTVKSTDSYTWKVKNLKAIDAELFMPDLYNLFPIVYVRPVKFIYDDVPGEITDWNSMAVWENKLLTGRQTLSDATKNKIKELTSSATTDKEKVKILYDYLGKNTRYQNISLGIGGYQPMPASEVSKVGFGDCKGLTNYLRAMLMAVDIKANYTSIEATEDRKNIFEDFANFNQFNHVILQVPLPNDTLWLECTNPELPFGFIHNNIAGHQAVVDLENEGKIVRLPDYPDSLNLDKNVSLITLYEDGKAQAKATNISNVKVYNDFSYFTKLKNSEQVDKVRKFIYLPSATVSNITFKEDKSALPSLSVTFDWSTSQYGNKTGSRLFIPVNPLRKFDVKLKKNKRKFDIEMLDGNVDEDSLVINIPENYEIEAMPAPVNFKNTFGSFISNISITGSKIVIHQVCAQNSGYWKAEKYQELLDLIDKVNAGYNGKIILKSKQ